MLVQPQNNDFKFREFKMRNKDDLTKKIEKGATANESKENYEDSSTKVDEDAFDSEKVSFNVKLQKLLHESIAVR